MSAASLRIGIARADITPPMGIRSQGFAGRGPLKRHHDPLLATVMVAMEGERMAALATCDLIGVSAPLVARIRKEASRRTGIRPDWMTVCATHTHYGPALIPGDDEEDLSTYQDNLVHILAGLVEEAAEAAAPVKMAFGWGASDIGVNRRERNAEGRIILGRNPGGFLDRAVGVLRLDRLDDGNPLACWVNFQAHPVSQGSRMDHCSADFPGEMRVVVESLTGARCAFLQGACGNINAAKMEHTYEAARTLGLRLGCEGARLWESLEPRLASGLTVHTARVSLPALRYGSRENAAALCRQLEDEVSRLHRENAFAGNIYWAELRLEKARKALSSWETGEPMEAIETEVQAWRLGDLALVTGPGEIFCQIGAEIKERSPFAATFFLGYANDSIGYVPTPAAYDEGGYEVTHACRVDPEAAGILTETAVELLHRCREEPE